MYIYEKKGKINVGKSWSLVNTGGRSKGVHSTIVVYLLSCA